MLVATTNHFDRWAIGFLDADGTCGEAEDHHEGEGGHAQASQIRVSIEDGVGHGWVSTRTASCAKTGPRRILESVTPSREACATLTATAPCQRIGRVSSSELSRCGPTRIGAQDRARLSHRRARAGVGEGDARKAV